MKKIILLTALFFSIVAVTVLSCSKSDPPQNTNKTQNAGQLITSSTTQYPLVTKYQKNGEKGIYDLYNDAFVKALKDGGALDEVSEANITYYHDNATQKYKASLVIIGRKNGTAVAHQFELLVNDDGYFEVQDPTNNEIQSHTTYNCSGSCNACNFTRDANRNITGCTMCSGGSCNYTKSVTAQDGMSTSDGIAGGALIIAVIAILISI